MLYYRDPQNLLYYIERQLKSIFIMVLLIILCYPGCSRIRDTPVYFDLTRIRFKAPWL